jgi:hypothetical protein
MSQDIADSRTYEIVGPAVFYFPGGQPGQGALGVDRLPVSHIVAMVGLCGSETLRRTVARLVGATAGACRVTFRGRPEPALA